MRLRDHLPTDSPDPLVIAKAQELNSVLVSLNGDFANITAYPPDRFAGIIALQLKNHPEAMPSLIARLESYLMKEPDQNHYEGRLILVERHRIRLRY